MKIILFAAVSLAQLVAFSKISATPSTFNPGTNKNKNASIILKIEGSDNTDSYILTLFEDAYSYTGNVFLTVRASTANKQYSSRNSSPNHFTFSIGQLLKPGYFSVKRKNKANSIIGYDINIVELYLIEPGDDVTITVQTKKELLHNDSPDGTISYIKENRGDSLMFSGPGSAKYICRYLADRYWPTDSLQYTFIADRDDSINKNGLARTMLNFSLSRLEKYKSGIDSFAYKVLKSDFAGKFNYCILFDFLREYIYDSKFLSDSLRQLYTHKYFDLLNRLYILPYQDTIISFSKNYPGFWLIKAKIETKLGIKKSSEFTVIENYFPVGRLRQRVIANYTLDEYIYRVDGDKLLDSALAVVTFGPLKDELIHLRNSSSKNAIAYNFSLSDTNGRIVRLADFKGKIVFIDFWFTGCHSCRAYFEYALSGLEQQYKDDSNIVFISVCVDVSKKSWMKSVYSNQYTSLDAVNLNTNGQGANNDVIKYFRINGYPRPLLIDKRGRIITSSDKVLRDKNLLEQSISTALANKAS